MNVVVSASNIFGDELIERKVGNSQLNGNSPLFVKEFSKEQHLDLFQQYENGRHVIDSEIKIVFSFSGGVLGVEQLLGLYYVSVYKEKNSKLTFTDYFTALQSESFINFALDYGNWISVAKIIHGETSIRKSLVNSVIQVRVRSKCLLFYL